VGSESYLVYWLLVAGYLFCINQIIVFPGKLVVLR